MPKLNCDSKTEQIFLDQTESIVKKYADIIDSHQLDAVYEKLSADNSIGGMAISLFSIIFEENEGEVFYSKLHNIPDFFMTCSDINSFAVPNGYQIIGKEAFCSCNDLAIIFLPKSVKKIKENAFNNCPNLELICYKGTQNDFNNISIENGNDDFKNAKVQFM